MTGDEVAEKAQEFVNASLENGRQMVTVEIDYERDPMHGRHNFTFVFSGGCQGLVAGVQGAELPNANGVAAAIVKHHNHWDDVGEGEDE